MFVCLLALAFSLNATLPMVSFAAIIGFFLSYGLGPGPVTWVVLSEVLPSEARTAGSSLGQACAAVTGFAMVSTPLCFHHRIMLNTAELDLPTPPGIVHLHDTRQSGRKRLFRIRSHLPRNLLCRRKDLPIVQGRRRRSHVSRGLYIPSLVKLYRVSRHVSFSVP
jgi:hypothetical protein